MGKSRAEIQKAYREKKKQKEGESYLAKERQRRMTYYTPSSELSRTERVKRNEKNSEYLRTWRQKKKDDQNRQDLENESLENEALPTSGYESVSSSLNNSLQVRFNFHPRKKNASRVRISRALSTAHRNISKLKKDNHQLTKRTKTLQKRLERMRKRVQSDSPRSKTTKLTKEAKLTREQSQQVRRHLILGSAVIEEIKTAHQEIKGKRKGEVFTLSSIVSGKIVKKYRGKKWLSSQTGIPRKNLGSLRRSKFESVRVHTRKRAQNVYSKEVNDFLERDDNSRCNPGKSDVKMSDNTKKQTRVLTDYMANLYMKFVAENPTVKLSRATFCRMRPTHILTTNFISRSTCLCTKHQNIALTLKSLRKEGIDVSANPESFAKEEALDSKDLKNKLPALVKFSQWKKIEVIEKEKKKYVTRIVEIEKDRQDFIDFLAAEFKGHVNRVYKQYEEIKRLKENLPTNHLLVQMDFAENYSCKSVEEIQTAYWNQTGVTLHPVVVYYKKNGETQHKSYVVVSDEMSHFPSTVHAFIDKLIPELKLLSPELSFIHYWTDGPTSQYRNRQCFFTVANHRELYGVGARWNYFEVGHGKGPCDGLGGTTKRMADEAVRCQKNVIQDAHDFFKWATSSNMKAVTFIFVSTEECKSMDNILKVRDVKPVKGTFKLHVVSGIGKSEVFVRETSCYCNVCLEGGICDGWRKEGLGKVAGVNPGNDPGVTEDPSVIEDRGVIENNDVQIRVEKDQYVIATYLQRCYVGKVLNVDPDDGEIEISFMENKKNKFQWPMHGDVLWIPSKDVLSIVAEPFLSGRSGRMLQLRTEDKDIFDKFLS